MQCTLSKQLEASLSQDQIMFPRATRVADSQTVGLIDYSECGGNRVCLSLSTIHPVLCGDSPSSSLQCGIGWSSRGIFRERLHHPDYRVEIEIVGEIAARVLRLAGDRTG